jgi:hypothetical protein
VGEPPRRRQVDPFWPRGMHRCIGVHRDDRREEHRYELSPYPVVLPFRTFHYQSRTTSDAELATLVWQRATAIGGPAGGQEAGAGQGPAVGVYGPRGGVPEPAPPDPTEHHRYGRRVLLNHMVLHLSGTKGQTLVRQGCVLRSTYATHSYSPAVFPRGSHRRAPAPPLVFHRRRHPGGDGLSRGAAVQGPGIGGRGTRPVGGAGARVGRHHHRAHPPLPPPRHGLRDQAQRAQGIYMPTLALSRANPTGRAVIAIVNWPSSQPSMPIPSFRGSSQS